MLQVSNEGTCGKVDYWECWGSLSKNCLNYWFIYPSTNFSFRSVSLLWDLGVFPSFWICVCLLPASRPGAESRLGYAPASCPHTPNSFQRPAWAGQRGAATCFACSSNWKKRRAGLQGSPQRQRGLCYLSSTQSWALHTPLQSVLFLVHQMIHNTEEKNN